MAETLVGIGTDGRPIPKLASSWEWTDEAQVLNLSLQPNLSLHDGTSLTAAVVRQLVEPAINRRDMFSYRSVRRLESVDRKLKFVLSRPEPFLLTDLASTTVRDRTKTGGGTGPFAPIPGAPNRFMAFQNYYRGRPTVDFVQIREYETQRSAWAALMRSETNAVHEVSPSGIDFVEAESGVQTFEFIRPYYIFLAFNIRHKLLGQTAVRQALNQAVNRQQIIDLALNGRGVPADGPVWPSHWAYNASQRTYSYNPEAAALRLDSAGVKSPVRQGVGTMPSRFRFTCVVLANEPRFERIALVVQKQLSDVGVDMAIEALPLQDLVRRISAGSFEAFLLEWTSGRSLGWTYTTWRSGIGPPLSFESGYTAADGALDRLRNSVTDNDVRIALSDVQQTLYKDPPAIFLAWPKVSRAVSTKFTVPDEPGRDVMGSLWQWQLANRPE